MSFSLRFSILEVFLLCVFEALGASNPPGWLYSVETDQTNLGVHCEGDYPPHTPQILQPWENEYLHNPIYGTYNSLSDICLAFEYSGRLINAGGYCPLTAEDPYALSFLPSQLTPEFGLNLYCKTKCWCTGGQSGPTRRMMGIGALRITHARRSYYVYHRQSNAVRPLDNVMTITMGLFAELSFGQDPSTTESRERKIMLTGISEERVICEDGPVPVLPPPLDNSHYRDLHEFCVTSLYGGSQRGNMGGYCHNYIIFGPSWDQDRSLAHPKVAGNPLMMAYCFAKCACVVTDEEKGTMRALPWDPRCVVDTSDGGVVIRDMTSLPDSPQTITLIPGSSSSGQSSGDQNQKGASTVNLTAACNGHESFPLCKQLASQIGEQRKPVRLDMATQNPISQFRKPYVPPKCGGSCSGAVDCSADCSCALDLSVAELHQLGQNPVFPSAECLLFSAVVALGNKKVSRLGGRSFELESDPESEPEPEEQLQQHLENTIACVCNATYVSFGCCGSQTGLIWENNEQKLGELKASEEEEEE